MTDYDPKSQDDPWLIKFFKDFETMPIASKADMDWSITPDFQVASEYLISDIRDIRNRLKNADDPYLYYVCQHIFNILDWMTLMVEDAGFPTFRVAYEDLFEKEFGDRRILQNLYDECLEKWLSRKTGQQKMGENFYNVRGGKLYYRNRFNEWFEVGKQTAFDLKPQKELVHDKNTIEQLNKEYHPTWYDTAIEKWGNKKYQGRLPDDFLQFGDKETDPDEYSSYTLNHIKALLKNPISVEELERWNGGKITDLEDIIKICAGILDMVKKRRSDNSHTLYLLRDCMMFYEIQETLDILEATTTSFDQIMVGRKLLSHESREWAYYVGTLNALFNAHLHYPTNFELFYKDYVRLVDQFVSVNPGFAKVVANLAEYINKHIQTNKNKLVVFDIGFQGSIALLTRYIIDRHISLSGRGGQIETDVKVGVVALWSKELFADRFYDDYFPFLNRVQLSTRSNDLYQYKAGSFEAGELRVLMGDKDIQRKAAIELVVLVMVTLLGQSKKET